MVHCSTMHEALARTQHHIKAGMEVYAFSPSTMVVVAGGWKFQVYPYLGLKFKSSLCHLALNKSFHYNPSWL